VIRIPVDGNLEGATTEKTSTQNTSSQKREEEHEHA
jgi:hypothetical protein